MKAYLRENSTLMSVIFVWFITALLAGPLLYLMLPATVFLFRSRDMWADMLFGFIIVLVASDIDKGITAMRVVKGAKLGYILALALIFILERNRFAPFARVWMLFIPFFIYSVFPILNALSMPNSAQKTLSYVLLYMVVPNYVLYNYRRDGWAFLRNLVHFMLFIMVLQVVVPWVSPHAHSYIGDRFRGTFGNPNALAIFAYLFAVLFFTVSQLNVTLFDRWTKVLAYGLTAYLLIKAGSRTSVVSTLMFFVLVRFFRISPILGFVSFVAMLGGYELVQSNITTIVSYLGLQDYLRVDSIEDGSGRYFAWGFAWQKLNEYGFFMFGGGFGTDERVMYKYHEYLNSMGHQGGIHNSYLTLWFNTGIVGLILYFRGFLLLFFKSNKRVVFSFAIMFSVLFSVLYESWLVGSLNPFTIVLLIIATIISEEEIEPVLDHSAVPAAHAVVEEPDPQPQLILPAR